ncbi:MAG: DUF177 domain-containing protein [Janthinobacterium lividum]
MTEKPGRKADLASRQPSDAKPASTGVQTEGEQAGGATQAVDSVIANPQNVDIFEFARSGGHAAGSQAVAGLPRMVTEVPAEVLGQTVDQAPADGGVLHWRIVGGLRDESSGASALRPTLALSVSGEIWLECQRCLAPYAQPLAIDTQFVIVETEAQAEQADFEDEEDTIVGSRHFDLLELIEEEVLLSLPIIPKHPVCPTVHAALTAPAPDEADAASASATEAVDATRQAGQDREQQPDQQAGQEAARQAPPEAGDDAKAPARRNPFAALAALRSTPPPADEEKKR